MDNRDMIKWQVSNFELSKKLKELGVKQESLFYWVDVAGYHELPELPQPEPMWILVNPISGKDEMSEEVISTFTVAELGEMLPDRISVNPPTNNIFYDLQCNKGNVGWEIYYIDMDKERKISYFYSFPTPYLFEANARAKMLIYLIENKLVEI